MGKEERMNSLTLKSLTKSSIWDIQENDVFRLWESAEKDSEVRENIRHYQDIIRSAFMIEEVKDEKTEKPKFEKQGYKVAQVKIDESTKVTWALKKKPIVRVTDLTYENIRHITAAKLVEVLDRNFGGGWDSLSQSIKDIIESGFDISTICAKLKPEVEKPRMKFNSYDEEGEENEDEDVEIEDTYNKPDEDDVEISEPDDDEINEDNYSTMMDLSGDDEDITADSLEDYADE